MHKHLSSEIFNLTDANKESFLIGHLLGDGAIDDSFRFLSSSKSLVNDIKLLINSLGIDANASIANNNFNKLTKGGDVSNKIYQVGVALNDFYDIYSKYLILFRGKDIVEKNKSRGKSCICENYITRTIQSVSDVEDNDNYYDLSLLDEPHSYLANGVVVSNCPAFQVLGISIHCLEERIWNSKGNKKT